MVDKTIGLVDGVDDVDDGLADTQLSQSTGHITLISELVVQKSVIDSTLYLSSNDSQVYFTKVGLTVSLIENLKVLSSHTIRQWASLKDMCHK